MSKIYHQSMTDGRKSNVLAQDGIFSSMLKNHHEYATILKLRFMPPIYGGWFLTKFFVVRNSPRPFVSFVEMSPYQSFSH